MRQNFFRPVPPSCRKIPLALDPAPQFTQPSANRFPPPTKDAFTPPRTAAAILQSDLRLKLPPPNSRQSLRRRFDGGNRPSCQIRQHILSPPWADMHRIHSTS